MKKRWMLVAFMSSIIALTACNGVDKEVDSNKDSEVKTEESTKETAKETSALTQEEQEQQSSIQSNVPIEDLYPEGEIRNYAERFIGVEAPDFTLQDVNGDSISLSDFKGKNVILEIAQTTCEYCLASQPKMDEFQKNHPDITVIQVFNEPKENVESFLKQTGTTTIQHSLFGDASKVFDDYEVKWTPLLFFVDKDGMIKVLHVGQMDDEIIDLYTQLSFQ